MSPLQHLRALLPYLFLALGRAIADGAGEEGSCPAGGCPDSGFQVPRVIIGCWQLLERHADREKAIETLTAYAKAGFTTFDTADIYGPSEEILGEFRKRWVAEHPEISPLRFFTKYVADSPTAASANRINAKSLQSIGIHTADLVQFHYWELVKDGSQRQFLQAAHELSRLKSEGKIRHLAGCNMDTKHLKLMVDDGLDMVANQVQYSLLDRRPEVNMLKYCKQHGIKLTVFGVVAGGLLSESFLGVSKSAAQQRLDSVSRRMYFSSLQRWTNDWSLFQRLLETLKVVGQRRSPPISIAAVACAWALRQMDELGAGGALILGVRDAGHLEEHVVVLRGDAALTASDVAEIQTVLDSGNPPAGDVWHQERGWA